MKKLVLMLLLTWVALSVFAIGNAEATTVHTYTYEQFMVDGELAAWNQPTHFVFEIDDGSDDVWRIYYGTIHYYITKDDGSLCYAQREKWVSVTLNNNFIGYNSDTKDIENCD